ncbi:heme-copper oxidase subunit III, partial [Halomicroarcula sp. GCM10025709]
MAGSTDVAAEHAESGDEHGEHEHRSRWPLVAAVGAAALYFGAGFFFVGRDLLPTILPTVLAAVGAVGLVAGSPAGPTRRSSRITGPNEAPRGNLHRRDGHVSGLRRGDVLGGVRLLRVHPRRRVAPEHLPELLGSLVVINTALLL